MKDNLQKMELIQEKIRQLKEAQIKIEHELTDNFAQVLSMQEGFQLDFDAMIGGLLEVIDTIRSDPIQMEKWRVVGDKFRKSKFISKRKGINKVDSNVETQYV